MENRERFVMKKDTMTFYHDYYARHDDKIACLRATYGIAGYGMFWDLIEMLWESEQSMLKHKSITGIAYQSKVDITFLNDVIADCILLEILVSDGEYFWSESVNRRKTERDAVRAKYSAAGKKGMENRYKERINTKNDNDVITEPNDVITEPNKKKESKVKVKEIESKVKEIKEKEIIEEREKKILRPPNIPFDAFWEHYDKKAGEKSKLEKKWNNLTDDERAKTMNHISAYKLAEPDKAFRKHPETYLNNKSFNDEIIQKSQGQNNGQQKGSFAPNRGTPDELAEIAAKWNNLRTAP